MSLRILQCNINHSRAAQDLMMHTAAERDISLVAVSEPHSVPDGWLADTCGKAALLARGSPCLSRVVFVGAGYIAAQWGDMVVCSCYISPNITRDQFVGVLESLAGEIRNCGTEKFILMGDFNARSRLWDPRNSNKRGDIMGDWAAGLNLVLVNSGGISTCVRPQGESVVDLTWASPTIHGNVCGWHVCEHRETLSDHRHIEMSIGLEGLAGLSRFNPFPAWRYKEIDLNLFRAALMVLEWPKPGLENMTDEEAVNWITKTVTQACDATMPRRRTQGQSVPKRAYWWSDGLQARRGRCRTLRRALGRAKRNGRTTTAATAEILGKYRNEKKAFEEAIRRAKQSAWKSLVRGAHLDPWGRAYLVVMGKLRSRGTSATESLPLSELESIILSLFPRRNGGNGPEMPPAVEQTPEQTVHPDELERMLKKIASSSKAPGPDGVTGKIWAQAFAVLGVPMSKIFTRCLVSGSFPAPWKLARLVLVPKPRKSAGDPIAYRPLCMLDEAGKLLERIVVSRMRDHLRLRGDLSPCQFGFREGRSTCEAIDAFRDMVEGAAANDNFAIGVSLDIKNAFGSLPWQHIRTALERRGFPVYIQRIIGGYLSHRKVCFSRPEGVIMCADMECGVPQGSVLGPLLWNITFDLVLRTDLPPGCGVVCYADDTLVVASGRTLKGTIDRASAAVSAVISQMSQLGLEVAYNKTDAVLFPPRRSRHPKNMPSMRVAGNEIPLACQMKYLGVVVDCAWSYKPHAQYAAAKAEKVGNALAGLMPNMGGPRQEIRKLYATVVHSVLLYAIPVWSEIFRSGKRNWIAAYKVQRRAALRMISAYRTVSYVAAGILAGIPPIDIVAEGYSWLYESRRDLAAMRGDINDAEYAERRAQLREEMHATNMRKWRARLRNDSLPSLRLRELFGTGDTLARWIERTHGSMTYWITQIFTGHGSFASYLYRIGKIPSPACVHCGDPDDCSRHAIMECPAFARLRWEMSFDHGDDFSLAGILTGMLRGEEQWNMVQSLCEGIMTTKVKMNRVLLRRDVSQNIDR